MSRGDEDWKDFAARSTCAALTHLGEKSQPVVVKIVWRVALIVGIALTAVSSYYSTMSFANLSGSSEMLLERSQTFKMEYPKFHICTSNIFNLTILEEMGLVEPEMISYFMLMMSILAVSPIFIKNHERQRQLEAKFDKILDENGIQDANEIIQRALFKCQEVIAGCMAPGVSLDGADCCAKYFPTGSFASTTGACVSTTAAAPFYQYISSMPFGFVVFVRDLPYSRPILDNTIVNPALANQKGVSFAVSDKWTNPTVALFQDKHYTGIGLWTSLAISKTTINDEELSKSILVRKPCASRVDRGRYQHFVPGFANYTENNCFYAVRQNTVIKELNCYMVTLPYQGDLPACRPHQLFQLALKVYQGERSGVLFKGLVLSNKQECVIECWKEMYSFTTSYADLEVASNLTFGNWTILPNQSNSLAALNFYYPTFTQTLLVNHYPTISGWLGVLGGNLGLFLGASMVTLIEVVVYCVNYCRKMCR